MHQFLFSDKTSLTPDIVDSLKWLENSWEPFELVVEKWKVTTEARFNQQMEENFTLQNYLDKYPVLKRPLSYSLVGKNIDHERAV
jgi:hypothetical protein